ncbi:MAG: 3-oxoacyl-ACP reductase FabG [Oscillospiraceae bacterium]|nr:3-oxoacyl-ACP reductase FabG [Oscillospiraceae bacterium]
MSVVLITGGTGAIGGALVEEFSRTDDVVFTYNENEVKAKELAGKFRCKAVKMDISDANSVRAAADCVIGEFKRVDILINNAGISLIKPFTDISEDEWERQLSVNLSGIFRVTKAVVPSMISRKNGAIVNISSVWGVYGASCEVAYSAAKAGVIGFTKALAKELAPSGITVNAVAPGVIESPMNSAHLTEDELKALCDETPLGRMGKPSEVAQAVRALAENRFITGQVLGVDGGFY